MEGTFRAEFCSVNLLHVRRGERCILGLHQQIESCFFIDGADDQVELDHAIHAARDVRQLVKIEARVVQGDVKEQPDH
eukprot:14316652-Heterocapsa_arctica.AAC.1